VRIVEASNPGPPVARPQRRDPDAPMPLEVLKIDDIIA
jgi:hypothetical protein